MDIFGKIIDYASMGVTAWGAVLAIIGIIHFSEGHKQNNASKKEEGMGSIVGGGVIVGVGVGLVPLIADLIKVSGTILPPFFM